MGIIQTILGWFNGSNGKHEVVGEQYHSVVHEEQQPYVVPVSPPPTTYLEPAPQPEAMIEAPDLDAAPKMEAPVVTTETLPSIIIPVSTPEHVVTPEEVSEAPPQHPSPPKVERKTRKTRRRRTAKTPSETTILKQGEPSAA